MPFTSITWPLFPKTIDESKTDVSKAYAKVIFRLSPLFISYFLFEPTLVTHITECLSLCVLRYLDPQKDILGNSSMNPTYLVIKLISNITLIKKEQLLKNNYKQYIA